MNDWLTVNATITGPPNATEDMLINGGREAVARSFIQVGDALPVSSIARVDNLHELRCKIEIKGIAKRFEGVSQICCSWGDYAVFIINGEYLD